MDRGSERALDPDQRIIDAHHHLYDRPGVRYLLDDYLNDMDAGHRIEASVFVQARSHYLTSGPESLKPVGETLFARAAGELAEGTRGMRARPCAAIVGYADLSLGSAVGEVLDAHIEAGDGRFRGVRHVLAWDQDGSLLNAAYPTTETLMDSAAFRAGFAELTARGLSFDAWLYFPQLPRLTELARRFPETTIVVDHCGGVLGVGAYAGRRAEIFEAWVNRIRDLATCDNVRLKLSGLGMPQVGFGFDRAASPASSRVLAETWRPWIEVALDAFGPDRCMFASNFPADRPSYGYVEGWNAIKRLTREASVDEKDALFWRTAARTYAIPISGTPPQNPS